MIIVAIVIIFFIYVIILLLLSSPGEVLLPSKTRTQTAAFRPCLLFRSPGQ